jgi:methionyl-tRNA formyltransferase
MTQKRKIAFFGSDEIALPWLRFMLEGGLCGEIAAVLTQPDRRSGRGRKFQPNAIKAWAMDSGLPLHDPEKPGPEEVAWLKELGVDLIWVMAYGHILKKDLLTAAPLGCFNLHASLLPKYRGASPIETSLAMGDQKTGVTLMEVIPRMDAGPVIDLEEVEISDQDTGPILRHKIADACVPLVHRAMPLLLNGNYQKMDQDEQRATYCRKLSKDDGRINFNLPGEEMVNRMRAFSAWPGTFFIYEDIVLRVGQLRVVSCSQALNPGERFSGVTQSLVVGSGNGAVEILEIQKPGGKMLPVADFLRGFSLPQEVTFSSPADQAVLLRKI